MKKNKLLAIIFLFTLCCNCNSNAVLKTTYSISSSVAKEMEEWADNNTIIFIALDNTLVRPNYKMVGFGANPYRNFESQLISNAKRRSSGVAKLEKWYNQRQLTLMEEEWRDFIQRMKDKGALVYGVSDMPMNFKDIEKKRYLELYNLGIEFSQTIKDQNILILGEERRWRSVFYQGIIFSGPYNKAKSIVKFINMSQYVPKKIIYFDVRENDVRRVDRELRPFDTDFYSIMYFGLKQFQPKIDLAEVKFQQMHFHKTGILLDDSEIARVMQDQTKSE